MKDINDEIEKGITPQSSISLSKTTKGYTYKVKIYNENVDVILQQLKRKANDLEKYIKEIENKEM